MPCPICAPMYCAPNRCYCGHDVCTAFASYIPRHALTNDTTEKEVV